MAKSDNRNDNTNSDNQGKMTVQEAGQKGGEATRDSHDRSFYEEIGSKGGQVSPGNFKNDPERAAEAGRKGGQARGQQSDDAGMDEAA
jgi:general stress protein YciG